MLSGFWGPFFGFSGAIMVALIANFLAEDFKRFRDGSALAAAVVGELSSYETAIALLAKNLASLVEMAEKGNAVVLPEGPTPKDWIYEKASEKLGLLGPELAGSVAETYGRIFAFRAAILLVAQRKVDVSALGLVGQYTNLIKLLIEARATGSATLERLRERSNMPYREYLRQNWMHV